MISSQKEPAKEPRKVAEFCLHEHDTGSVQVQVALLTERINQLNEHFERFPQDFASRVGLMKLVGRRRRLMNYLKNKNKAAHTTLVNRLGLRE